MTTDKGDFIAKFADIDYDRYIKNEITPREAFKGCLFEGKRRGFSPKRLLGNKRNRIFNRKGGQMNMTGIIKKAYRERKQIVRQTKKLLTILNDLRDYEMAMNGENCIFYKANVLRDPKMQNTEEIIRVIMQHHDTLTRACGQKVKTGSVINPKGKR